MAISFRSQTFQDTKSYLDSLAEAGELTKENVDDKIREAGVDPKEYRDAFSEFSDAVDDGETDFTGRGMALGRVAGRVVGETVDSVEDVINAFTGADVDFGEFVPEALKEYSSEIFDPYHGSGAYGQGEKLVGEIGSYFIPATGAVKFTNLGVKGLKAISPGTRAAITNAKRRAGRRGRKASKVAGYGAAGAFGTTVIEDPRDNLFDMLLQDEEGEEALKRLEQDPEDPTAVDYLDAFVKNAAIEIPAAFALGLPAYLRKAYKVRQASRPKEKVSFLGKLNSNISSRMGTDDKTLSSIIKRHGAAKAAVLRADGLAKDLDRSIKKEVSNYTPEIEAKLNNALQFSDEGLVNAETFLQRAQATEQRLINKVNTSIGREQTKAQKRLDKFREEQLIPAQNALNSIRRNQVDYDEISQIAPETRVILDEMRSNIDDLSSYVENNVVRGKLKARIGGNKGFYLNRSYEAFDNPQFAKELEERMVRFNQGERDDVIEGVQQYLLQSGIDPDKVPEVLESLLPVTKDDTADIFSFLSDRGIGGGIGTSRVLSKRGDIPEPLRAMWGEVTDPRKNYVKTFEKLATIKAEDQFLRELAQDLVAKGVASTDKSMVNNIDLGSVAATRLNKILGRGKVENKQVTNPLEGVYIDPVYAKAIAEGLEENAPTSGMLKTFMLAKGATQTAKTVFSPATHGRNLMGNIIMLGANGIVPGFKSSGKSLEQVASRLAGKNNKELADAAARYAELGITDSGIGVNLIRRNLNAFTDGGQSWMDKTALTRGTKNVNTFLTNLYQAEDDMFKIIHFEKTLDYMKKAFPDKPLSEIEEMAAQRTRDMMPNYSLVPRFVKNLRGAPVGDFIAFPAEMIRTTKNLVKYTIDDLASGNKELQKAGAKRLAGLTAAGIGGDALSAHSRQYFGITDDQEDAINNVVPSYEAFQDRIYMSGINKDKMGKSGVNYVNLGPLDPYSYLKAGAKAAHSMIADGSLNEAELNKLGAVLLDNQLGPFLEPSMITKSLIDLASGKKYLDEPTMMGKIQKAAAIAVDPFVPGVANYLKKRYQYEQTKADSSKIVSPFVFDFGEGKNLPEGITPASFTISGYDQTFGGDVGLPAFFGVRNQRLDLTGGMKFAINPTLTKIRNSDRKVQQLIADPTLYSDADADTLYNAYVDTQRQRLSGFQELKSLADSYRALFGDDFSKEIVKGMKLRGEKKVPEDVFRNLNLASSNYFIPSLPQFGPSERMTFAPIPYQRIFKLRDILDGTQIEEE